MIVEIIPTLELFLEKIMEVKAGQNLLVIADNYARSLSIGQAMMNLAILRNVEATLTVMKPRNHRGQEPPKSIAAAMKATDIIFEVVEEFDICHTTARKEASEAGVKYFVTCIAPLSEDYFKKPISFEDLEIIKERTEKLVKRVTQACVARVTTPFGTDITMNIEGRQGIPLHPLTGGAPVTVLPDYAEAAISPNEGTSEGVIVIDSSVQGWGYLLSEPIRFTVRKGRVEKVFGDTEDVNKFREVVATDENSNNCAAELGIGTSHTCHKNLNGSTWNYALKGPVHIAVGRNNDIGGATWSKIHNDVLLTQPTVELDGEKIMENGKFLI